MMELTRKLLLTLVVSLLAGLSSTSVNANVTDGTISGKVTHNDGVTAISGATVKALQGATVIASATSNGTGDYTLTLAPGTYTIEASAAGFGIATQSSVTVSDGGSVTLNIKLDAIVSGPVTYVYDAVGRLVATVGPSETTIYSYDAVGNLLSISRQPATQLSIISVVPSSGAVGQLVTIYGTGFSTTPTANDVKFDGVSASVLSATSTRIITTVPSVNTGQIQITVTTSAGTVSAPFTVTSTPSGPNVQVAPANVWILPGETQQFFATVNGITGDQSVQWSVNGINGGNTIVGTISSTGLYTSPNQPTAIFAIRATSVANPAVFGQAQIVVLDPSYSQSVIASALSVRRQALESVNVATAVSVRRLQADSVAPGTSVSVKRLTTESVAPAARVSVRRLAADSTAPISSSISVRFDPSVSGAPHSAAVSVTSGPLIDSVSPTSGAKNTSFTLTLTGSNFDGATGLSFLTTAGALDSTITASNISVDGTGTSLTVTITVSSSSALGQRIVVVTTPNGNSFVVNVGPNVIEIVQ